MLDKLCVSLIYYSLLSSVIHKNILFSLDNSKNATKKKLIVETRICIYKLYWEVVNCVHGYECVYKLHFHNIERSTTITRAFIRFFFLILVLEYRVSFQFRSKSLKSKLFIFHSLKVYSEKVLGRQNGNYSVINNNLVF